MKTPWMIQITLAKDAKECPLWVLRKMLKGSGVEVDRSYRPAFVGRGRFVGRGFATERAVERFRRGNYRQAPRAIAGGDGVLPNVDLVFSNLGVAFFREITAEDPVIDGLVGASPVRRPVAGGFVDMPPVRR